MNNIEKKLDALIDALGFDAVEIPVFMAGHDVFSKAPIRTDIKITKRDVPVASAPTEANKPPIGLKPKRIHNLAREDEIISAMIRYLKDRKPIPPTWLNELRSLQTSRL
jgi:hypothetical protein